MLNKRRYFTVFSLLFLYNCAVCYQTDKPSHNSSHNTCKDNKNEHLPEIEISNNPVWFHHMNIKYPVDYALECFRHNQYEDSPNEMRSSDDNSSPEC